MPGWVYILGLSNGKFYFGSTTDLVKRLDAHQCGMSDYTSKFLPVRLVFSQKFVDILVARKAEKWLKKLRNVAVVNRVIADGRISKDFG